MDIRERIYREYMYFDGGYGTLFQANGLQPGEKPETWNITNPEKVVAAHAAYLEAGAGMIKTNTFGANMLRFPEGGEFELKQIIEAAIDNVGQAKERTSKKDALTMLSVGPLGKLLAPMGDLDFEEAVKLFKTTISIGVQKGIDGILIETINDIYEAKAAILAAKEACELPVFLTCAFDESGRLLTGATPEVVVAVAEALGVDAVGANCSVGPDKMVDVIHRMVSKASIPVICNPNAGLPRVENGRTVFDCDPESFGEAFRKLCGEGATIVGGCCGTTPEHIRRLQEVTAQVSFSVPVKKDITVVTSYTHTVEFGDFPVLIGERINPTGKKRFKEALRNHDIAYILNEGISQENAHVLDVNVGIPEIDEAAMMKTVVMELQSVSNLPLQIDTSDIEAMEKGLRIYNGKPMVNSVNGKGEVMEQVFPLVKKYGGVLVGLTIDEDGIPETAEGRLRVAEKIMNTGAKYGILPKDIIIDPLCMSISADKEGANTTLRSMELIHELGLKTSLGVSNISFGLPRRDIVNGVFFTMALERGLSAAIMNPGSNEMMKAYRGFMALRGKDRSCESYIEFASKLVETGTTVTSAAPAATDTTGGDPLIEAIIKGLKENTVARTKEYLQEKDPMDIIDNYLIAALDIVGQGFENKTIFLPQLLSSAEAAGGAFTEIKKVIEESGQQGDKKGTVILATVKGDVHDIGKNIVKVLLENYGYNVIDLGKDVDERKVLEAAKESKAPLVGLSALMTTTVPSMERTIKLVKEAGLDCKVCVGGAVMTSEYADMIGADKYCKDAMETVRYAEELFEK